MLSAIFDALSRVIFMALHTVNTGSFLRPLTAEQEWECLMAFREKNDLAARGKLIEHNLRLVAHIVKKYYNNVLEQEDLISVGSIGLIKAVETFDCTKGIRLATYASRCIENEILMYFRAGKKSAQDVSFSEPIDTDKDGNPLTLIDVIAGNDTIADDLDLKINSEKLNNYIREVLECRERQIIAWRYGLVGDGMTQREVAEKLNISRSYVSRIEKKALEKLRARFNRGAAYG